MKEHHPVGVCNACGESDVDLFKVSLGKDFFNRPYDRLTVGEDLRPQWFCGDCSREKDFQRDIRVIRNEFEKLRLGQTSFLNTPETFREALDRVKLIEHHIKKGRKEHTLLPPGEVVTLLVEMARMSQDDDQDIDD
ncbi:MAG: hypothetical protein ACYCYP_04195 [Leptospirales bacterium]